VLGRDEADVGGQRFSRQKASNVVEGVGPVWIVRGASLAARRWRRRLVRAASRVRLTGSPGSVTIAPVVEARAIG
jgi:hypothetical protein